MRRKAYIHLVFDVLMELSKIFVNIYQVFKLQGVKCQNDWFLVNIAKSVNFTTKIEVINFAALLYKILYLNFFCVSNSF